MENELVKRLMWASLLAGVGFGVTFITERIAAFLWRQIFNEDPPD